MSGMGRCCAMLVMIATVITMVSARPKYMDCADTAECGVGTCCVLGAGRFSIPRCSRYGERGEHCRPSGTAPRNFTLSYPDGQSTTVSDVFYILCPCSAGLYCSHDGFCEDSYEDIKHNDFENDLDD